jgi:hypothetical protein
MNMGNSLGGESIVSFWLTNGDPARSQFQFISAGLPKVSRIGCGYEKAVSLGQRPTMA